MSNSEQILVVVEPDNHPNEVLERAAWLAGLNESGIALLWCDPDVGPMGAPFFVSNEARDIGEQIRTAQRGIIEELAASVRDLGITVTTEILEERPIAEGILHYVQELKPAYLLKGTEYHAVAERSIFVDTDWQLMRSCPCPLWLVKPAAMHDQPVIVASVDPGHSHDKPAALDQTIVDFAKGIAAKSGGELHLLHTYQALAAVGAAATRTFKPIRIAVDEIDREQRAEHRQKLEQMAGSNGIDAEHTHLMPGAARDVIPAFARNVSADLVVMGSLARWGVKRAVIGSTAERVLDHLPGDILIVRADS